MEVYNDGKFNLIETDDLIVKNKLNYSIFSNKKLTEYESGALYLIDNSNNDITINLPYVKNGLYFEFIFIKNTNNKVIFKNSQNPVDNSKIIGTDWIYLKRSYINISYSALSGSIIEFNKTEQGEHIKFYTDGLNYYIIDKNDTNNNINNILQSIPSNNLQNYIININLNQNLSYDYNIVNENTNEILTELFLGTNYNFKFNTASNEYNTITTLNNQITYKIFTFIDDFNSILYNLDTIYDSNSNTFILNINGSFNNYKYPILNYNIIDSNFNKVESLKLLNTNYLLDIFNNSILYPTYNYNNFINNDLNNQNILESNTSILNIYYDIISNNLIIYNENNQIIYDHNNDRRFLIINRDIKYTLNYFILNESTNFLKLYTTESNNTAFKFTINTLDSDISTFTYTQNNYFKFSSNSQENNTFTVNVSSTSNNKNIYYLSLKYDEVLDNTKKHVFIIPLIFLDHLILQTTANSPITLTKNNNITNNSIINSYSFNVTSSTQFESDYINLIPTNTDIINSNIGDSNIFNLITQNLKISLNNDNINNHLLKFMDNNNNIIDTTVHDNGIYKIFNLNLTYNSKTNKLTYYSLLNNINGGQINLKPFIIDDSYSGKLILVNLKNNMFFNFNSIQEGNYFNISVNNDNSVDDNTYKLIKQKNKNNYNQYYFIKNNDSTNLLSNITLYSSNIYHILIDRNTINTDDIKQSTNMNDDVLLFSTIEDGTLNFNNTESFSFIKKNINTDNTLSYILNINESTNISTIYYYNKNTKSMGGRINFKSNNDLLKNIQFSSIYPFSLKYKYYINNISYQKLNNNYIVTLKKLKKGDSIQFYYQSGFFFIKESSFSNNNIIDYPDNIISTNNLNSKMILNNDKYDISFIDTFNNTINYLSSSFKFIKNQKYYISHSDISHYNLNLKSNNHFYIKLNNNLNFEIYNDSKFQILNNNILLYRKNTYYFNQYHRSNYNPGFNIDFKQIFKVTYKLNSNNQYIYFINGLESYSLEIIKNVSYYFDLSDILHTQFRLSLYQDGLNNNVLSEFNDNSQITYNYITINNIQYINNIILNVSNNSTITNLYYFSILNRNIGGSITINNSQFNYYLDIQENKSYSNFEFYLKKHSPTYSINISDSSNNIINKCILYKNILFSSLSYNFNLNNSITNYSYNNDSTNSTINIYVSFLYDPEIQIINPKLGYFGFYKDINLTQPISLPLTLLKDKYYNFIQPNYSTDIFKFYIYLNSNSSNYFHNFANENNYDTDLITKLSGSGFTFNTSKLYNSYIYYSGIHYNNSTGLYTGTPVPNLNNHDKICNHYKIFIIPNKNIYLSDNINNSTNITNAINITSNSSLSNKNHLITMNDFKQYNILNNDLTHMYLQNNIDSIQNITLNINIDANQNYLSINKLNTNYNIYISDGTNYNYASYNSYKNKTININSNTEYNITLNSNSELNIYKFAYYNNDTNQLTYPTSNITNLKLSSSITDYFIYNNSVINTIYNNNNDNISPNLFTFNNITPNSISSNFYNINTTCSESVYEYFITFKSDLISFTIDIPAFNTNTLHSMYLYTNKNDITKINNTTVINTTQYKLFYIDINLYKNGTTDLQVYHLVCFKEDDSIFKHIVDFGKLYINDLDNSYINTKTLYKSLPVNFNLTENQNHNLPNSSLINQFTIKLNTLQYYDTEIFEFNTSKSFNIVNKLETNDIFNKNNVISSNLYITDFKTLYFDISDSSLLDTNITFYSDESATSKITDNIIYTGKPGLNNSKIIINLNSINYSTLFYYSDCLYQSSIKYPFYIDTNDIILINNNNTNKDNTFKYKYKYKYNIVNYLENNNEIDYYYNGNLSLAYINFNKCYFILYNSTKLFKGTIYTDILESSTTDIKKNIYLVFDNFITTTIDCTYTLKIFNYKNGQIITPNYLHFNKFNNNTTVNTTHDYIYNNNTNNLYTINNKPINYLNESYLKYINTEQKFYITKNINNNFNIKNSNTNQNINFNTNQLLNDYTIDDNTLNFFQIKANTPALSNSNKIYYTYINNNLQFIDTTHVYTQNTINESSSNCFNIHIEPYYTYTNLSIDYYAINANINSLNNMTLLLKPLHSYTFIMNDSLIYKINNKLYKPSFIENNIEQNFKLSIVNFDDTKTLYNTIDNILNINLPIDSPSRLYIKIQCKLININDNTELKFGYYDKDNNNITNSYFTQYIPIIVDLKSVIKCNIKFNNLNYFIENNKNLINHYNNFTYIYNISNLNIDSEINFTLKNKLNDLLELNSSYYKKSTSSILLYTHHNHKLSLNSYNNIVILKQINTEIVNNSKKLLLLNESYNGNYSNPNDESNYYIKYIGQPGFNGQLVYNVYKTLDFNINIKNKLQNYLYIHYNIFNKTLSNYIYDLYNISDTTIDIFEPIKLKIQQKKTDSSNNIIYTDINYTFSSSFFPGKPNSNLILELPNDIDNDNIFLEDLSFSAIGYYSNNIISTINNLVLPSDIYTLQQETSTIFLNIKNNIIIRLPLPNYSFNYNFIVTDSNKDFTITFLSKNSILVKNSQSPNLIINNNNIILKSLIKGQQFQIVANNNNYFIDLDNNINTNYYNLNFPSKNNTIIKVNNINNKFILNSKSILNKNINYIFDTNLIKTNYFNIYEHKTNSTLNITNVINFNNYSNLYTILQKNNIINSSFTSFITNKPLINYKVSYNPVTNSISFNNSVIPILYSNYIYSFDISSLDNFYILLNSDINTIHNNNINTNNFVNIFNNSSYIYLILNDTVNINNVISYNNIFNNSLLYYYYKPIEINLNNNTLIIDEYDGFTTHKLTLIISEENYNIYNFSINTSTFVLNNSIINMLNNQLKTINRGSNFTFSIQKNQIILSHTSNNFSIQKNNFYNTLNFTSNISHQKQLKTNIKYIKNIFNTDSYLNYYGNKLNLDFFTLNNLYDNNSISIDLTKNQHINLPPIKNNITYTIIINNTLKNKSLYIHSNCNIYYLNESGNILVLKPNLNENLFIGSYLKIHANNDYYMIIDSKNIPNILFYNVKLYNTPSNFHNLYYDTSSLELFDKYISIFDIHLIGLTTTNNKNINELKFLHVAKVLSKLLDYNETGKPYDINIINTLVNLNSYIVLYDKILPSFITDSNHQYYIAIDYNKISLNYDFNYPVSNNNPYDYTLDKLLHFITYSYIYTYPHQFKYDSNIDSDFYKYIDTNFIDSSNIIIEDLRTNKTDISIENIFYDSSKIINNNNTNGINLSLKIIELKTTYSMLNHSINKNKIKIISIGNGYKNNDSIKIELLTNLYIHINLKSSLLTTNINNCHNQVYNKLLDTSVFNQLYNNKSFDINNNESGLITNDSNNTRNQTSIKLYTTLYSKELLSINDSQIYLTHLLLGLLDYYKKRFYNDESFLNDSILITPTLIELYNQSFIDLYNSSTLNNIKSLKNIKIYNLSYINYIKSKDSSLNDLELIISNSSKLDFNKLILNYDSIIFDNYLIFNLNPTVQFSTIITTAFTVNSNNKTSIPVLNSSSIKPIIDVSSITSNNYNTTTLEVLIEITSEDKISKTVYTINASRTSNKSNNTGIKYLTTKTQTNKIYTTEIISDINSNDNQYRLQYDNHNSSSKLRTFIFEIQHDNIYSSSNINISNITDSIISTNSFYKNYSITTESDNIPISITITSENNTTKDYKLLITRKPHNKLLLTSILLSNVKKLNNFNKYNYYYNGLLSKNDNININITKEDTYSKLIITSQYYSTYWMPINYVFNDTTFVIPSLQSTITDNTILNSIKYQKITIRSISEDNSKYIDYIYLINL